MGAQRRRAKRLYQWLHHLAWSKQIILWRIVVMRCSRRALRSKAYRKAITTNKVTKEQIKVRKCLRLKSSEWSFKKKFNICRCNLLINKQGLESELLFQTQLDLAFISISSKWLNQYDFWARCSLWMCSYILHQLVALRKVIPLGDLLQVISM